MRTRPHDLLIIDPEDLTVARDYANRAAAAAAALRELQHERQRIDDLLRQEPAASLLDAVDRAREDVGTAQGQADRARVEADSATAAAARFQANELAVAQADLDAATRAVSDTLAGLLAQAQTSAALTATVDGLALRSRYITATASDPPSWDHTTIPFRAHPSEPAADPQLRLPAIGDADHPALLKVLGQLDHHVDTVADLATAEGVHQLVQGNPARSGAALNVASGGAVPDHFDIIRTPSPGHHLTHRILILLEPDLSPAWAAAASTDTIADPALAALVSRLVPDPATAHVTARRVDPATGTPGEPLVLTLDALGLDPLGWVRLSTDPAELHQRIAHAARTRWAAAQGDAAATGQVLVDDTAGGLAPPARTLADLRAAAAAVQTLIAATRALTADDLTLPTMSADAPDPAAVATVSARIDAVEQRITQIITDLDTAAQRADRSRLLDALFAASALGEAAATPQLTAATPDLPSLRDQASAAAARLHGRLTGDPFAAVPDDPAQTLRRARTRLTALCGSRLPILTPVPLPPDGPWQQDLAGTQPRLLGADPAELRGWLHTHARVRPGIAALLTAHDTAEALDPTVALDLRATQLPTITDDGPPRWVGADPAPPEGAVGLVIQRSFAGTLPTLLTGLLVDEWTQTVPAATLTAGLTFHYDEPDATPAQSLLVAVAPDLRTDRKPTSWDLDTLLDILTSTLALARDRAVNAEHATTAGITLEASP